jgi:uncharacterized protein
MASSLLTLLDDIASMLDDIALLAKTAASKTSAVMGDDLALNAKQVSGVDVDRELPVVWAVAKGSLLNKVILVPAALMISAFMPKAILPLMMIGGLFLCFEGVEKVLHKLHEKTAAEKVDDATRLKALADPSVDLVALEREKIKGAIRTDFILSAEIIVIALGTMAQAPLLQQVLTLSVVALGATVLVYGLVAGIVKLDDAGLALTRQRSSASRAFGSWILTVTPLLMKALSVLGTAAMFTVGGSIIAHGAPPIEHLVEATLTRIGAHSGFVGTLVRTVLDASVGLVAGAIAVAVYSVGRRVIKK